jgi:hypothetical protein
MSFFYESDQQKNARYAQHEQYQSFYGQPYARQPYTFPESQRGSFPAPPPPQKPRRIPPMPKAQALELVEMFKRGIVVASLLGFGTLSALVLSNMHISASTNANQITPSQTNPFDSSSDDSSGDSTSGGTFQQGGYGFGSNSPSQGPATRSHAS